jgi:hypothetical protein
MKDDQSELPEKNDPLDALLRDAEGYIPDNGFTARVVGNLPVRRRQNWRRFIVISISLLIGAGLAAWQYPAMVAVLSAALKAPVTVDSPMFLVLIPMLAAFASLAWGAYAMTRDED